MIKKQLTIGQVIARFNHAKSAMNLNAIKHISYNLIDNTVAYLLEYKKVKETRLEAKEIDYIISLLYKCHVHKVAGMLYSEITFIQNMIDKLHKQKEHLEKEYKK